MIDTDYQTLSYQKYSNCFSHFILTLPIILEYDLHKQPLK